MARSRLSPRSLSGSKISSRVSLPDEFSPLVISGEYVEYSPYHGAFRAAPIILLYGLAYGIYGPSYIELMKYKVCGDYLNYSSAVCSDLGNPDLHHEMNQVRKMTSYYQGYGILLECIPAIILSLFLGSWSDHFGRRFLFLFPFFGFVSASIWTAICAVYAFPPTYILISAALSAVFGGRFIILMAAFSFTGDYTDNSHRALNNAIVEGCLVVGMHGGSFFGGYSYYKLGMFVPFVTAAGLYFICILLVSAFIHDRKVLWKQDRLTGCGFGSLFSFHNLRESWTMLRMERRGDTRFHVFLVIMASFISNIAFNGKAAVTQLFLEFAPFKWTLQQFTLFTSILGLVGSASVLLCVALFHKLRLRSTSIAMIAYTSAIIGYIGYSVATTSWMIIVSAAFGHMRLLCTVCIRSVLSEMVQRDELGKIMALLSLVQSTSPLLGSVLFVDLFAYTAHWWSGLCFALGSFTLIWVLGIFAYMDVIRRDRVYADF